MSSHNVWEFTFRDEHDEHRTLELQAEGLELIEWEGYTIAKDPDGKTRASAPNARFVSLEGPDGQLEGTETIDVNTFVDRRHAYE